MKSISKDVPAAKHKPIDTQELGNITGRHTPGLTTIGGGDQLAHSLSHYGKDAPQLIDPFAVTGFPRPGRIGRR